MGFLETSFSMQVLLLEDFPKFGALGPAMGQVGGWPGPRPMGLVPGTGPVPGSAALHPSQGQARGPKMGITGQKPSKS